MEPDKHVTLHAVAMLLAGLVPLSLLFRYGGRSRTSLTDWTGSVAPVLAVGVLSCLLLNVHGAPLGEWLIPALSTMVVAAYVSDPRIRTRICWACFGVALFLFLDFILITQRGYTAEPERMMTIANAKNSGMVSRARRVLQDRALENGSVPVGKIERDVNGNLLPFEIPVFVRLWHTPWTRLFRIDTYDGIAWSTGEVVDGKPVIEIRRETAKTSSAESGSPSTAL